MGALVKSSWENSGDPVYGPRARSGSLLVLTHRYGVKGNSTVTIW